MVADLFAVVQEIAVYDLGTFDGCGRDRTMNSDLLGTFAYIFGKLLFVDRSVIDYHVVKIDLWSMFTHYLEMPVRGKSIRLAGLGHQVTDADLYRVGICYRLS